MINGYTVTINDYINVRFILLKKEITDIFIFEIQIFYERNNKNLLQTYEFLFLRFKNSF